MGKLTQMLKRAGYIPLHLLLVAMLALAWWHQALMPICSILLALYMAAFVGMLCYQHKPRAPSSLLSDFLEDTTTTYYFGAVMIAVYLLSRIIENNLLLAVAAIAVLAGPLTVSLLRREHVKPAASKQR